MLSFSRAFQIWFFLLTICSPLIFKATGGTLYATSFETFGVGPDKIVSTDGWTGTISTTGRSGIDSETEHGTPGLGNAGWLGGNSTSALATSFNVRRHIPNTTTFYDPLASDTEVVTITALVGIKDSDTSIANRDRFELFIASGTGATLIASIQFDNVTKDGSGNIQQLIRRSTSTAGFPGFNTYTTTNNYFLYDTIHKLYVRINFRTNRWTAILDDAFLFLDEVFYIGTTARNLGAVGFRVTQGTPGSPWIPGTNYMIFDDLSVQADALENPMITDASRDAAGTMSFKWTTEFGYRYNIYSSENMNSWNLLTATPISGYSTGNSPTYLDYGASFYSQQFYRVKRIYP